MSAPRTGLSATLQSQRQAGSPGVGACTARLSISASARTIPPPFPQRCFRALAISGQTAASALSVAPAFIPRLLLNSAMPMPIQTYGRHWGGSSVVAGSRCRLAHSIRRRSRIASTTSNGHVRSKSGSGGTPISQWQRIEAVLRFLARVSSGSHPRPWRAAERIALRSTPCWRLAYRE